MNKIPDVPVNFQASINNQLPRLRVAGGVEVVTNTSIGVAGLILYNRGDRILAYDRCSSINPQEKNPVSPLAGNIAEDKVSGAYFNLDDGSAAKAPAKKPLRNYAVTINGDILIVSN